MIRRGRRTGIALIAAGTLVAPVEAQQASGGAAGGAVFESYTFDDADAVGTDEITLLTFPFSAAVTFGQLSFRVQGAYARGRVVDPTEQEFELDGLTDTSVGVDIEVVPGGVVLSGTYIADTGGSTQTLDQAIVAGAVATDLLPFRTTNWGSGGGFGAQLAGTASLSNSVGAGISIGYRQAGEFEPVAENVVVYQAGNEIHARLALDFDVGRGGKLSMVGGIRDFAEDQLDGTNLFQSGRRLEGTVTYAFPSGYRGSGAFYGGVIHRENGIFLAPPTAERPSQDLVLFGAVFRRPALGGWFSPRFDGRAFRSEDGVGQGFVGSVGLSLELSAGGSTWIPTVAGRFGSIEISDDDSSSIFGLSAGLTLRLSR